MPKLKTTRIGSYAILTDKTKLLLCRLCGPLEHAGRWTLPGGGQDFGETLEETVVREVKEETGLNIEVGKLVSHKSRLFDREDETLHSFQFLFMATISGGNLTHETDGSTDLVKWIEISEITESNSVDIVHRAKEILRLLS